MPGYIYKGTNLDVSAPMRKKPGRNPAPHDPTLCGTRLGYKQHERMDTPKCQPCLAANTEYRRALRASRKGGG